MGKATNSHMMAANILVNLLMGKNKAMADYCILIEQSMMVNLRMEIFMELAFIKAKAIIMKEIGNKEKCMGKGKVNGTIKIHNL